MSMKTRKLTHMRVIFDTKMSKISSVDHKIRFINYTLYDYSVYIKNRESNTNNFYLVLNSNYIHAGVVSY